MSVSETIASSGIADKLNALVIVKYKVKSATQFNLYFQAVDISECMATKIANCF
jgi:hypothetical protein